MESMDYVMEIGSNRLCCDAEKFTGVEMGRFVNQGGLVEDLEIMCDNCDIRTEWSHIP